jgi:hypothetical protein
MANLIWPVEAVLLGVWGFVLSMNYSTSFHQFISLSQLVISSITLFVHALVASRAPTRALAVSQAHSCAIAALFMLYVAALMHPSLHAVAFNSPTIFGPWPLAASVGLSWMVLLLLGAIAMCIPDINDNQRSALMLHPFGYHMLVLMPCLVIINATSAGDSTTWYAVVFIWLLYVGGEILARSLYTPTVYCDEKLDPVAQQSFIQRLIHSCTYPLRRVQALRDMRAEGMASFVLDLFSKSALIGIGLITFFGTSGVATILCGVILLVAVLNHLNWLAFVDWVLGEYEDIATPIGDGWPSAPLVEFAPPEITPPISNIVQQGTDNPTAPPAASVLAAAENAKASRFRMRQLPELNLPTQWREKNV